MIKHTIAALMLTTTIASAQTATPVREVGDIIYQAEPGGQRNYYIATLHDCTAADGSCINHYRRISIDAYGTHTQPHIGEPTHTSPVRDATHLELTQELAARDGRALVWTSSRFNTLNDRVDTLATQTALGTVREAARVADVKAEQARTDIQRLDLSTSRLQTGVRTAQARADDAYQARLNGRRLFTHGTGDARRGVIQVEDETFGTRYYYLNSDLTTESYNGAVSDLEAASVTELDEHRHLLNAGRLDTVETDVAAKQDTLTQEQLNSFTAQYDDTALSGRVDTATSEATRAHTRHDDADEERRLIRNHTANNTASISTNAANISGNTSNIGVNSRRLERHQGQIDANYRATVINADAILTNSGRITTNSGRIDTNTAAIAGNSENISMLTVGVDQLRGSVSSLDAKVDGFASEINKSFANGSAIAQANAGGEGLGFGIGSHGGETTFALSATKTIKDGHYASFGATSNGTLSAGYKFKW